MKKILFFFCCCLLVLASCSRTETPKDLTVSDISEEIQARLGGELTFTPADEDFTELNFKDAPSPLVSAVYFADSSPVTEYGVFEMKNRADADRFLEEIKTYLQKESRSKSDLERLYPGEITHEEMLRYQNGICMKSGNWVCYFVGDERAVPSARAAFEAKTSP